MQREHVDLTQVLGASQVSLICSILPSSCNPLLISLHFALPPSFYF